MCRWSVGTRKGDIHPDTGWQAKPVGRQWPPGGDAEIYHLGVAVDPGSTVHLAIAQLVGQQIRRSNDGGTTWSRSATVRNTKAWPAPISGIDGTPHPWEFKRVWHLEPALTDPDVVYASVEDAAMFRTTDGGATWQELSGLRKHGSGSTWAPGAGGLCLHTILLDPTEPDAHVHCDISGRCFPQR